MSRLKLKPTEKIQEGDILLLKSLMNSNKGVLAVHSIGLFVWQLFEYDYDFELEGIYREVKDVSLS